MTATKYMDDINQYINAHGVLVLPEPLRAWPGHIYIANNDKLISLGNLKGTSHGGSVVIKNCINFETLGDSVEKLDGALRIVGCPNYKDNGPLKSVVELYEVEGMSKPAQITVKRVLDATDIARQRQAQIRAERMGPPKPRLAL